MLIKFKHPDPRAGLVALMDSSRGHQLVDSGAAEQASESNPPLASPQLSVKPVEEKAKPKATKGKK